MRRPSRRLALALSAALLVLPALAAAGDATLGPVEDQLLTGPAAGFGQGLAIAGDTLAVGAAEGAVLVHGRDAEGRWSIVQRIDAPFTHGRGLFGHALALDEGALFASAPLRDHPDGSQGLVIVHAQGQDGAWRESARIDTASIKGVTPRSFGWALATDGHRLVVGAPGTAIAGVEAAGAAFVFERGQDGTWRVLQALTMPQPSRGAHFGQSVAIHGDQVLVGVPGDRAGSVRTFTQGLDGSWSEGESLMPVNVNFVRFGHALLADAGFLFVGAPSHPHATDTAGNGAVFEPNGENVWDVAAALSPPDAPANAAFGASFAFDGTRVAVGAPGADAVYTYAYDAAHGTWAFDAKLRSLDDGTRFLGHRLASHGGSFFASAPASQDGRGSVSVFGPDADGDRLGDWREEHVTGTDPALADTDGDGLSDGDEVLTYGTDPRARDTDGDCQDDGYEAKGGSDPNDPERVGTIIGPVRIPGGQPEGPDGRTVCLLPS